MDAVRLFTAVLIAGLLALAVHETHAQDGDLAVLFQMEPRAGAGPEFEQAITEHARWRTEQGDPWIWDVYQVVMGDNLGTYIARAPERAWADFDAYDAGFGPRAAVHFNQTVGPLLRSNSNTVTRARTDVLRLPEDLGEIQVLSVNIYRLKPGMMQEFWGAAERIHEAIVEADFPVHYTFHTVVAGGSGPEVHVVRLHRNWADMEEPDPSLMQVMQEWVGVGVRVLRPTQKAAVENRMTFGYLTTVFRRSLWK